MPLNLGAFLGGNQGQGGIMAQLQAGLQQKQQQADAQNQIKQLLAAFASQQNPTGGLPQQAAPVPPQGMPPQSVAPPTQAPPTGGGQGSTDPVVRQMLGMPGGQPQGAPPAPTAAKAPQQPTQAPPVQGGELPSQLMKAYTAILSGPGTPQSKLDALKTFGALESPIDKFTQAMDKAVTQSQFNLEKAQMLRDSARDLVILRGQYGDEKEDKKEELARLKDDFNEADMDYRAGMNNQVSPEDFKDLKDKRDAAKKLYDDAKPGKHSYPAAEAAPAPEGDTVKVISPDGRVGTIPSSQLQDALAAGYKQQ